MTAFIRGLLLGSLSLSVSAFASSDDSLKLGKFECKGFVVTRPQAWAVTEYQAKLESVEESSGEATKTWKLSFAPLNASELAFVGNVDVSDKSESNEFKVKAQVSTEHIHLNFAGSLHPALANGEDFHNSYAFQLKGSMSGVAFDGIFKCARPVNH